MAVIVRERAAPRVVVVARRNNVGTVTAAASGVAVPDARTAQTVTRQTSVLRVAAPGPQGAPGAPGGTSEQRIADGALGGHRIVRSTGATTVGYADHTDTTHGDDTVGMTLGAAGAGQAINVQRSGSVTFNGWAWEPGEPVFLGVNGLPTQTPPESGVSQVIGHAESPTSIYIDIQPPYYFD